jgi:hypothetical protein
MAARKAAGSHAGRKAGGQLPTHLRTFVDRLASGDDVEPCKEVEAGSSRPTFCYCARAGRNRAYGWRRKLLADSSVACGTRDIGISYRMSSLPSEHLLERAAPLENNPRQAAQGLHPVRFRISRTRVTSFDA